MVRLILTILSLLMALPAAAMPACHEAAPVAATMAHHGEHHVPAPEAPIASHDCIGCIPPCDWAGRSVSEPLLPVALAPSTIPASMHETGSPKPTTPPPRLS